MLKYIIIDSTGMSDPAAESYDLAHALIAHNGANVEHLAHMMTRDYEYYSTHYTPQQMTLNFYNHAWHVYTDGQWSHRDQHEGDWSEFCALTLQHKPIIAWSY